MLANTRAYASGQPLRRTAEDEAARSSSSESSRSATHALAKRLVLDYIILERRREKRIKFEPPLNATCVAVDGTGTTSCRVIEVSNSGAQLECPSLPPNAAEFFLLFTSSLNPVYRRCERAWVRGIYVGVKFLPPTATALVYEPED